MNILPALGPKGEFRTKNTSTITDVAGVGVAELSLVPALYVSSTLGALRRASSLAVGDRIDAMTKAAALFATGTLGGQTAEEYQYSTSRVGGVPISAVRAATAAIVDRLSKVAESLGCARPGGAVGDWRDPSARTGTAVWTRRGNVFAVHAAGNSPAPHGTWPEALALGYRVAIRPSSRDPFTPHRLVTALRAAGFPDDHVVFLPADHAAADVILRGADLGIVYGGEEVVEKYAKDPKILPRGPGRSKILVTADTDWRQHLDVIVESVTAEGGTGCVNTTGVFVEGDPAPLAEAIAGRLVALPALPPQDDKAALPAQPLAAARAIEAYLLRKASTARAWLGGDGIVHELGDGSAVLGPAVYELDDPAAPQAGIEMPFPCVWVAPWTPDAGLTPLRDTLVLTAITQDAQLLDRLLDEPSISNVYIGDRPTHWMAPGVPHDGYLADFLMRNKGVVRDASR